MPHAARSGQLLFLMVLLAAPLLAGCTTDSTSPEANDPVDLTPVRPTPLGEPGSIHCDPCDLRVSHNGVAWEPHALADPDDPDRIVVFTGDGGGPTFYASSDGGKTWTRSTLPTGASAGPPASTWLGWGDPALAYHNGTLVAAGLGNTYAGTSGASVMRRDVWVATSDDLAATFSNPVVVTSSETVQVFTPLPASAPFATPDREFIAVSSQGQAALSWVVIRTDGLSYAYDLMLSRSDDMQAWSEPEVVHLGDTPRGPYPVYMGPDPWVVFSTYGRDELNVASSGEAWTTEALGPGSSAPAVASRGERLAVATTMAVGDIQVPALYTYGPAGWSGPHAVAQPEHSAAHVSVAYAAGEVWVGWYDADPQGEDSAYRISRIVGNQTVGQILVADGLTGDVKGYGDYVFGLNGREDGASVTYVVGQDGRWIHHQRIVIGD